MKKYLLQNIRHCLVVGLTFCTLQGMAQLPDNSIAPNFTATDINGQEHTLYDYLDEGKSVLLHFGASWSIICWRLKDDYKTLYEKYGPDGTDEIVVLFIECSSDTDRNDLDHTSGSSGVWDWVTTTPYPIIEDLPFADTRHPLSTIIANEYGINEFVPGIYHICPDRVLTYDDYEDERWNVEEIFEMSQVCKPIKKDVEEISLLEINEIDSLETHVFESDSTIETFLKETLTEDKNIRVYPTMTEDRVNIEVKKQTAITIQVYNATGQLIYTAKSKDMHTLVNMSEWSKGTYLLHVLQEGKTFVEKVVLY